MLIGQSGYVTEPYFLTQNLRSQNRFHDPLQDSLFSHAGSVQGYRDWNAGSGRSSPLGDTAGGQPGARQGRTLLVRSSRPIRTTASPNSNSNGPLLQPQCVKVAENVYEAHLPCLITPRTKIPGKNASKAICYAILEVGFYLHDSLVIFHARSI